MKRKAKNFYRLLKITWFSYHAHRQKGGFHAYVNTVSRATIERSRELNDGSVPEKIYLKKQWYKVSTLFLGQLLSNLLGVPLARVEKKRLIYLGAAMGLCDVLVDDHKITRDRITSILTNKPLSGLTCIEQIFSLYYHELISFVPEEKREAFISVFLSGVDWQIKSLRQFSHKIKEEEVQEITVGKGGVSIVLCSLVLNNGDALSESSMMSLGAFIQAMNDAQDLPKDAREELLTFVSFKKNFEEVFKALDVFKIQAFNEVRALNLPFKQKETFCFNFYAMYTAICFKLHSYKEVLEDELDFKKTKQLDKSSFAVNPYSWRSLRFCLVKILEFHF